MDTEKIVQNIQRACKAKGTTPTVAARESGAGQNMITAMKKEGRIPSVEKMSLLAAYLGVTTSELLGEKKSDSGAVSDAEAALDQEIISRLVQLTPEELEKVDAFVQGLLAAR